MKTKLVQVATKGEYQQKVSDYLSKGYSVVDKGDRTTVLRIMTQLNRALLIVLILCAVFPAFLYLIFFLLTRKNELVTVEWTAV